MSGLSYCPETELRIPTLLHQVPWLGLRLTFRSSARYLTIEEREEFANKGVRFIRKWFI